MQIEETLEIFELEDASASNIRVVVLSSVSDAIRARHIFTGTFDNLKFLSTNVPFFAQIELEVEKRF